MCTLITVDRTVNHNELIARITADSVRNDDGWALLTLDDQKQYSVTRSLSLSVILAVINETPWERLWLHARAATQGQATLRNCHGWESRGVFYMHNGILSDHEAKNQRVDSMLIGRWIHRHSTGSGLIKRLQDETFANVIMVSPEESWYSVFRSIGGSLYTDGKGNYSTNKFSTITDDVPPSISSFDLPKPEPKVRTIGYGRFSWDRFDDDFGVYGRFESERQRAFSAYAEAKTETKKEVVQVASGDSVSAERRSAKLPRELRCWKRFKASRGE